MEAASGIIIAIAVVIIVLVFAAMVFFQKRNKPKILKWANQTYEKEGIREFHEDTFFTGLASQTPKPAGGYGIFGLTEKRIFFRAYLGPFQLDIPYKRLLEAKVDEIFHVTKGISISHRGKESKSLLIIKFQDEHGIEESCGFSIMSVENTLKLIKEKKVG